MTPHYLSQLVWRTLLGVAIFNALSAVSGGVLMLFTGGLGMPLSMLENSPFPSFVGPAIILLVVIGGTQALATVLMVRSRPTFLLWSAVAGFAIIIWIMIEAAIIRGFGVLQALYFSTGIAQLALVLALLGIVAWLPRVQLAERLAPTTSRP
ncbi:hypothetical protein E3T23_05640 [Cryobacterium cheniae]|uniref:Uncharacterized protein n=1 Tax=Cryobacterium cheniae TaxID=1259262 RepID=A0A4R8XRN0_9MICO|nr:hypothetical protein [Cryobacterium cheniae]TFC81731.1 hypothetical protein E3T23_05640 [Cryobacterium cheniae]